jgi:phosphomannomutase
MNTLKDALTYQPVELGFGTSGLRGLVTDMTDLECYINSRGFLEFLEQNKDIESTEIYIAGDLRKTTPRILQAVLRAVTDKGYVAIYCGLIPTPALAYYASLKHSPCIMVTGSHIPDDRNGIKFYKSTGEVLKEDEHAIKACVAHIREQLYAQEVEESSFNPDGSQRDPQPLIAIEPAAEELFLKRYTALFPSTALAGKKVVVYQHSAVGRDFLVHLLEALGAEAIAVGRSESFIPIDTENVTPANQAYFHELATQYPDAFAIISTDGDSDRPFVIDERGVFHRGDVLGALIAEWLNADLATMPISSSDAADQYLTDKGIEWKHTKIGSPYVITAMQEAQEHAGRVVGWEVNGGFMTGSDFSLGAGTLSALPTRDAVLPIIGALLFAIEKNVSISKLFVRLPERFTDAGLIDNFPSETSKKIMAHFEADTPANRAELSHFFTSDEGFDAIAGINTLDGIRIFFKSGDIAHLRPSGNAPQLRMYSVAGTEERAAEIVRLGIKEPHGILRRIEKDLF